MIANFLKNLFYYFFRKITIPKTRAAVTQPDSNPGDFVGTAVGVVAA